MKCVHLIITGFVQGVGYRKFVRDHARKLGLVGYVRNMPDNSVEVVVVGDKEIMQVFIEQCKKGPFMSEVKDVEVAEIETQEEFTEFLIRHDF